MYTTDKRIAYSAME